MHFLVKRLSQLTKGGIAGLLAVLLLAGVGLFFAGTRYLQTTPHQCVSCHPQLTAMWKRSKGHPADRVTCTQCHAAHAELPDSPNLVAVVRDEIVPSAFWSSEDLVESRCEQCHGQMRQTETEQEKLIKINHKIHLTTGKGPDGAPLKMRCLDCHRTIAHDKAQIETNRPTMAGCFAGECHRKDRNKDNCRRCHYQLLVEPGQKVL